MNPKTRLKCTQGFGPQALEPPRTGRLILLACGLWLASISAWGQPILNTNYPLDRAVRLGANSPSFQVFVTSGSLPYEYKWFHNQVELPDKTNSSFLITNVQPADLGTYFATVKDASGHWTTSRVATLYQELFTKITTGPVATTSGTRLSTPCWGDLNNDGFEDLIVTDEGSFNWDTKAINSRAVQPVFLNQGNGTFLRATVTDIGPFATNRYVATTDALADYDNDGYLDLYQATCLGTNQLWRGGPGGKFTLVTESVGPNVMFEGHGAWAYAWGDYDGNGFLDLYITTAWQADSTLDYLFRSRGDGTFEQLPSPYTLSKNTHYPEWVDYDNDGDPDLYVGSTGAAGKLYRNEGAGQFVEVTPSDSPDFYAAWGDFDNDSDLDFYSSWGAGAGRLYENDGQGGFTPRAGKDAPLGAFGTWVDLDNDGYLELLTGSFSPQRRYLCRYDPQTRLWKEQPSVLSQQPRANANLAFCDYDNDGFMDVIFGTDAAGPCSLYRNTGNGNHWLHVKPVGTRSNRSAIGARITVVAKVFGQTRSQIREVMSTVFNQNLRPHFGLGDADKIDTLRIRWPAGLVQEFAEVAVNQILTVVEGRPVMANAELQPDGRFSFRLNGGLVGKTYVTETSPSLNGETWTAVSTNAGPSVQVQIPGLGGASQFYRVREQ